MKTSIKLSSDPKAINLRASKPRKLPSVRRGSWNVDRTDETLILHRHTRSRAAGPTRIQKAQNQPNTDTKHTTFFIPIRKRKMDV